MADILKRVSRSIPPNQRTLLCDQGDAAQGDFLLIESSLGHLAGHLEVTATDEFAFRLNVIQEVFPLHGFNGTQDSSFEFSVEHLPFLSSGQRIEVRTGAEYQLAAGGSMTFDQDIPICDLEIIIASGVWSLIAH